MNDEQSEFLEQGQRSILIKGSAGVRKSRLCPSSDVFSFPSEAYDNVETAWDVLERGCRLYGRNRCLGCRNSDSNYSWISYNDLKQRAQDFGSGLVNLGISPGQNTSIAIYGTNSIEWVVAAYACFSQSLVIIPLFDGYSLENTTGIIRLSEVEFLICDSNSTAQTLLVQSAEVPNLKHMVVVGDITEDLKQLGVTSNIYLHSFHDVEVLGKEKPISLLLPVASDVYMVACTSGTSGEPKGVVLSHKHFVCAACSMLTLIKSEGVNFSETDVMMSHLSIRHVLEHFCEMMMMLVGGSIGFYQGEIDKLEDDIHTLQPTFLPSVPFFLNKFYDKGQRLLALKRKTITHTAQSENLKNTGRSDDELNSEIYQQFNGMLGGRIRKVLSGGAMLSEKVLKFYRFGLGYQIIHVYGLTETGPATINVMNVLNVLIPGNIGVPLPSVNVKLVDVPEMNYFSKNNEGEICVKGLTTFKCYFKNPQKTTETMDTEGWIHSGDVGKFLPDGSLKIVERMSNIFKISNGWFITPEKIETIYSRSKYASQVFIYGDSMRDYVVSIVVPDEKVVLAWIKKVFKYEMTSCEACKNPELKKLILDDMCRLGNEAGLNSFEQARAVHLHAEPLTYKTGHLTEILKIKRAAIRDFFKGEIEAMYEETYRMKEC